MAIDLVSFKHSLNIVDVISSVLPLVKRGVNYQCPCPFHNEKSGSFTVNPDKQFYYCFGCGAGGDVIGFYMDYNKVSFLEAVTHLSNGTIQNISDDDRQQYNEQVEEQKRLREEEQKQRRDDAAKLANEIWKSATDASYPLHDYLARKQVASHGLRTGSLPYYDKMIPNALFVPVMNGNKIVSLQAIFDTADNPMNRTKTFLFGGEKKSCFFRLGKTTDIADQIIVICEGYATAASIHETTKYPVFMAFDSGNLIHVAEKIRKSKPKSRIIIAADNDRKNETNTGVIKATEAAKAIHGFIAIPQFKDMADLTLSDFNDLHDELGGDAVIAQINAALEPVKAIETVETKAVGDATNRYDYLPDTTGKDFKPISTIENLIEILRRLNITAKYNIIKKEQCVEVPDMKYTLDNQANAKYAHIKSECARFKYPTGNLMDFLTNIADANSFNPVKDWICSVQWDGKSRLAEFYATITTKPEQMQLRNILIKRWLISAIASAFSDNGAASAGVLVLQGAQNLGKSAWFNKLTDQHGFTLDGFVLRCDDKDSVKQAISHWLVELAELDSTFKKSELAELKAFLTRNRDVMRLPYSPKDSEFVRRTVFCATVNPSSFLQDHTGNKRFWVLECLHIDYDHKINMQQLWREVHDTLFAKGEPWHLTKEENEMLTKSNTDFETIDPIEEMILGKYNFESDSKYWRDYLSATEILKSIGYDKINNQECARCAHVVKKLNGNVEKKINGYRKLLIPLLR